MLRTALLLSGLLLLLVSLPEAGHAQDWMPPSREMPAMPQSGELNAGWISARGAWLGGASGNLSVAGDGRSGSGQVQVVRVTSGPLPVVVWQDRNGDGRADLIEIYRSGSVVVQVIDAEYDGQANVVRRYDANGALIREDRV